MLLSGTAGRGNGRGMSHLNASWANAIRLKMISTKLTLSTDHSGLRGVVSGKRFEFSTQRGALKSVKHRLNRGKSQRFTVKNEVVLLAKQGHKIEDERLIG